MLLDTERSDPNWHAQSKSEEMRVQNFKNSITFRNFGSNNGSNARPTTVGKFYIINYGFLGDATCTDRKSEEPRDARCQIVVQMVPKTARTRHKHELFGKLSIRHATLLVGNGLESKFCGLEEPTASIDTEWSNYIAACCRKTRKWESKTTRTRHPDRMTRKTMVRIQDLFIRNHLNS